MGFQKGSSKTSKKTAVSHSASHSAHGTASSAASKTPSKTSAKLASTTSKKPASSHTPATQKLATKGAGTSKRSAGSKNPGSKNSASGLGGHSGKRMGASLLSKDRGDSLSHETVCREVACEGLATSSGYCRLHYIKNWKKIKRKEGILREGKLNQYIEELVIKYPDKYIEAIRQDLASDKDFAKVIYDLDLDEGIDDFEGEGGDPNDSLIDTIKRDFEDEGEAF